MVAHLSSNFILTKNTAGGVTRIALVEKSISKHPKVSFIFKAELSSSTIFNHDTAFGEIIRKHRLSEDSFVDAPKEKDSSKHMNKQKLSLLENELKKIRKKKRSTEKVERSSDGPRFFENN
jgi:hypothetical protein